MPSGFLGGGIGPTAIKRRSGLAAPVPVAGAELLVNGGFESWSSATDANGWNEAFSGTSSVNRESSIVSAGAYSLRLDIDISNSSAQTNQAIAAASQSWVLCVAECKSNVAGKSCNFQIGAVVGREIALSENFSQYLDCIRTAAINPTFYVIRRNASGSSLYVDQVSAKVLVLSSLFSTRAYASADCDLSVAVTRTAGTQAGLCARLDSAATPASFIIAYETGAGRVRVDKCVAGTYTNIIDGAVTYTAGRVLRLVCAGNDVSVYYNGTQVGSTTAVADAGIVSNTRHGLFSTYAANTFTGYVAA